MKIFLFSIPNGGKRNKIVAAKLKREGVKAGIPDLMLPYARGGWHGLFIEMKRIKGGSVSKIQGERIAFLRGQNYQVKICKGAAEAIEAIKVYMSHKETK
jgi:hypothetical protein